ncbi:sphingosine kinase 1-like [Magnolia sinica]|uniref:sphingosine kinase 1-like n=1 Tax=Magnolia sinica TaxID=86752 RepID=UPI00265AC0BF|nr:sphingosine kinase 1-like [Magnolia sinica]
MKEQSLEMESTPESPTLVISEQIRVNGTITAASLSTDGKLRWKTETGTDRCLNVESEVLGFSAEGSGIRVRVFAEMERGFYCSGSRGDRARKDFVLEPLTEESKRVWCEKLTEFIESLGRPKRLFILVNPFGGKKCALKVFHSEVQPLLEAADIHYILQETQYQLHAKEIANSLDLSKYDGIVCVSGDGVLVEVVNGLLQREDWEAAIKMPLGVVPAGTGNGMVKSLLDSVDDPCTVSNATFAIIRGHKRSLDVSTVLQRQTRFFSVLMLAWGFVADVDIESEKYRWMGSARLDFYSILRVIRLRKYHGCISFIPALGYENYGDPINQNDGAGSNFVTWNQNQEDNDKVQLRGYQGPLSCSEDLEWRTIEGPFISVWLHNVPWASEDAMPAPEAKFSDGYLDLIIIRDCPKTAFLGLLTKMNDGGHVKSPYVMYLKVKAFRLEPGQQAGDPTKGGIIDSDGEVLARGEGTYKSEQRDLMDYGPIQMTVDKGLASLFSPR